MAESIGIEPMRRFHVYGLANRCFNHSANSPNGRCEGSRTLTVFQVPSDFKSDLSDQLQHAPI